MQLFELDLIGYTLIDDLTTHQNVIGVDPLDCGGNAVLNLIYGMQCNYPIEDLSVVSYDSLMMLAKEAQSIGLMDEDEDDCLLWCHVTCKDVEDLPELNDLFNQAEAIGVSSDPATVDLLVTLLNPQDTKSSTAGVPL